MEYSRPLVVRFRSGHGKIIIVNDLSYYALGSRVFSNDPNLDDWHLSRPHLCHLRNTRDNTDWIFVKFKIYPTVTHKDIHWSSSFIFVYFFIARRVWSDDKHRGIFEVFVGDASWSGATPPTLNLMRDPNVSEPVFGVGTPIWEPRYSTTRSIEDFLKGTWPCVRLKEMTTFYPTEISNNSHLLIIVPSMFSESSILSFRPTKSAPAPLWAPNTAMGPYIFWWIHFVTRVPYKAESYGQGSTVCMRDATWRELVKNSS